MMMMMIMMIVLIYSLTHLALIYYTVSCIIILDVLKVFKLRSVRYLQLVCAEITQLQLCLIPFLYYSEIKCLNPVCLTSEKAFKCHTLSTATVNTPKLFHSNSKWTTFLPPLTVLTGWGTAAATIAGAPMPASGLRVAKAEIEDKYISSCHCHW